MSRGRRRGGGSRGPALTGRALGGLLFIVAVLAVVVGVILYAGPGPRPAGGQPTDVILERGAGTGGIATALKSAGVIRSRLVFLIMARVRGGSLKAGEYAFAGGESMASIISDLKAGRVVRHFVTVPEGWTSAMAAQAVNTAPVLAGQAPVPPEGSLLPETYEVRRGDDRAKVIARMQAAQAALLAQLWAKRRPDLPYASPKEAVTLASIVEKETGLPAERPRIAAVFLNRLKAGMRLESDPTVIYGVSQGAPLGRGLTVSELAAETPYNTYRITGLPPTPIANPGKAALAAVLNPPQTDELYFVANGTGGHVFAATYAQHQANVARWRQIEHARAAAGAAK